MGAIYCDTSAPLDIDFQATEMGSRVGQAASTAILGLVAWGDASVSAAAKSGGIKTVKHVDYNYVNVLWVYQRFTTMAHGD